MILREYNQPVINSTFGAAHIISEKAEQKRKRFSSKNEKP
jgi:hypothetical protein